MEGELVIPIYVVLAFALSLAFATLCIFYLLGRKSLPRYIAVITKGTGPRGNTRSVVNVHHYGGNAQRAAEWAGELANRGEANLADVRTMTQEWWGNRNGVYIVAEAGHRQEVRQVRSPDRQLDNHYRVPSNLYQVDEGPTLVGAPKVPPQVRKLKN